MKYENQFLDELSIIIVTWNGDALLANCLQSLVNSCGNVPEVIVVDNAGLSSTRLIVERYEHVKYLPLERNVGFSGGNNVGLTNCTRRYVLLLNNDTVVHEQPFTKLIRHLKGHPEIAVVQGRMNMPLAGNVLDACGIMMSKCGVLMDRYSHKRESTVVPESYVYAAKGACLLFDRTVLDDLKILFYDHFFNNHEETDFCHRVWLSGRRVAYVETPAIDHLCNQSVCRIQRVECEAQSLSNHLFSYLTLFGMRGLLTIFPVFCVLQILIALRFLFVGKTLYAHVVVSAVHRLWQRRGIIRKVRHEVQSSRRISDSQLFKMIVPPRSLQYGWLWLRGRQDEFWN